MLRRRLAVIITALRFNASLGCAPFFIVIFPPALLQVDNPRQRPGRRLRQPQPQRQRLCLRRCPLCGLLLNLTLCCAFVSVHFI